MILAFLAVRPALADLIARLVAQRSAQEPQLPVAAAAPVSTLAVTETVDRQTCWLTPVKDHETETATECIKNLVGQHGIYAFGERTPGRTHIRKGDWICFYASGDGVIAHAKVASSPENRPDERVAHPKEYPYTFRVGDQKLYSENPVVLDATVRQRLDAFTGRDPDKPWAWFVQATRKISEHDFRILTRTVAVPT